MEKRIQGGSKADPNKIIKNPTLCVKNGVRPTSYYYNTN